MSILITGGAGFVGSSLAYRLRESFPNRKIVCFDNLRRRGSESNLSKFKEKRIEFIHGDIRHAEDLEQIKESFDLMIEASAEPSVHSGLNGGIRYLIDTNLYGTINCLEFCRQKVGKTIFLSTSRVYSIDALREIPLREGMTRFEIDERKAIQAGLSAKGISEQFEVQRYRSLYGATKLCSELIVQEYVQNFKMDIIVNRCGVIVGPRQWGKVDQGVFTLWVANHFFRKPLRYTGFGGAGKQVRDLLHPDDLFSLILKQLDKKSDSKKGPFNVGGGVTTNTSMLELTDYCTKITGNNIVMDIVPETDPMDIPLYITDTSKVENHYDWRPKKKMVDIVNDIYHWLKEEEKILKHLF